MNANLIMSDYLLKEFNQFLGKASLKTYAGSGPEVDPEEAGFKELEFKEGDWYYRDSYAGFFQSWGREVVWHGGKPFWTQVYGGGMMPNFQSDVKFAHETFNFLKRALATGEKQNAFQPRGPKTFIDDDWEYFCEWNGDIKKFGGYEKILFKKEIVFTHFFGGGMIITRES